MSFKIHFESVDQLVECPVELDLFKNPIVLLPCCHLLSESVGLRIFKGVKDGVKHKDYQFQIFPRSMEDIKVINKATLSSL